MYLLDKDESVCFPADAGGQVAMDNFIIFPSLCLLFRKFYQLCFSFLFIRKYCNVGPCSFQR